MSTGAMACCHRLGLSLSKPVVIGGVPFLEDKTASPAGKGMMP
jgi:hypothetical protein